MLTAHKNLPAALRHSAQNMGNTAPRESFHHGSSGTRCQTSGWPRPRPYLAGGCGSGGDGA
jgi:hypothetical protein